MPDCKKFGYVRVSSKDQNEDRQRIALLDLDIPEQNIFSDKCSGKDFSRPAYQKLLSTMKKGDLLHIQSIDRLGRNYREILEQWRYLVNTKEVDILVLDMPLLDTRRGKDLMGTFLSDIVLQVLSFVAEAERKNIRERQAAGIAAAKARGVKFGRPSNPLPPEFYDACKEWMAGKISARQAAKICGMNRCTFQYQAGLIKNRAVESPGFIHGEVPPDLPSFV